MIQMRLRQNKRAKRWTVWQKSPIQATSDAAEERVLKINPVFDVWDFLIHGGALGVVFLLLLLASVALAVFNLMRDPAQRTGGHAWNWFVRVAIGGLWWQQSLWKTPPTYGVDADGNGGLRYWMEQMVQYASTPLQSHFVANTILPHFAFFAPQVYLGEVLVAGLLMLGLFNRLAAVLGALMALNLWLGLYRSPTEWIWAYFFLVVIQVTFVILRPGRSWGADAILNHRALDKFDWLKRLG